MIIVIIDNDEWNTQDKFLLVNTDLSATETLCSFRNRFLKFCTHPQIYNIIPSTFDDFFH